LWNIELGVEWGSCIFNRVNALHIFIECAVLRWWPLLISFASSIEYLSRSTHLCVVLNSDNLELVPVRRERLLQVLRLLGASYSAADGVAGLEQLVDDVERNLAVRAGDEDLGSCVEGERGHDGR
jgi:hypothetical protein